ncbi:hypothetical protein GCM10023193_22600 [Planotetraspora kaengkrachanensis]|uniref:Uncharacterized protein n=1 Tax=Planotetraspora kaengkrachanensis TaxID=575193 RepID=A0A8J3PT86_9ACTN|nr:hypothetical protein Pka01_31550 [Planotetraspora kaengkrachanensis]
MLSISIGHSTQICDRLAVRHRLRFLRVEYRLSGLGETRHGHRGRNGASRPSLADPIGEGVEPGRAELGGGIRYRPI